LHTKSDAAEKLLKQRASHFYFPEGIYVSVQSTILTDKSLIKMENFPLENNLSLFFLPLSAYHLHEILQGFALPRCVLVKSPSGGILRPSKKINALVGQRHSSLLATGGTYYE
jgi:hypothetical protein